MKRPPLNVVNIAPNVYQILDVGWVYCTLVVGGERAMLIDTGYGIVDVKGFIASVTDKPCEVVITHGHIDHIGGNNAFPYVYMSDRDTETAAIFHDRETLKFIAQGLTESHNLTDEEAKRVTGTFDGVTYRNIEAGQIFDLGGIHLEVVGLPGHSPGSIGLLWQEERILFAGDALNSDMWLFMPGCSTFAEYRRVLEETLKLPFDRYLSAHSDRLTPKEFLNVVIKNIDNMRHDPGTEKVISGCVTYLTEYAEGDYVSRITYSEEQLKGE